MQPWWTGLAEAPPDDATALHALSLGFMAARTLHVALEFDLFTHLSGSAQSLNQIAQALGLAERAAMRLLHACAALGLIQHRQHTYQNVPLAERYLVQGRSTYIGSYIRLFDSLGYHRWSQLGEALRRNAPVDDLIHPYRDLDADTGDTRAFLDAQHDGSTSLGYALARRFDFSPYRCLLDLGGGTGTYTLEILRHYPHLQAIIFDLPQVCRIAQGAIERAGLTSRVQTVDGDYEHDPLPTGPDVVLWSGNLHASSVASCQRILRDLYDLIPVHGVVLLHDYLLDPTGTSPLIPALMALHLTLVSEQGQVYSETELRALLEQAGFPEVHVAPFLPGHSGLVMAHKSQTGGASSQTNPTMDRHAKGVGGDSADDDNL
jgi:SAM-dependent methyltransferase